MSAPRRSTRASSSTASAAASRVRSQSQTDAEAGSEDPAAIDQTKVEGQNKRKLKQTQTPSDGEEEEEARSPMEQQPDESETKKQKHEQEQKSASDQKSDEKSGAFAGFSFHVAQDRTIDRQLEEGGAVLCTSLDMAAKCDVMFTGIDGAGSAMSMKAIAAGRLVEYMPATNLWYSIPPEYKKKIQATSKAAAASSSSSSTSATDASVCPPNIYCPGCCHDFRGTPLAGLSELICPRCKTSTWLPYIDDGKVNERDISDDERKEDHEMAPSDFVFGVFESKDNDWPVFMFGHRGDAALGLHPRRRPHPWLNLRRWSWVAGYEGTQYEYRPSRGRGIRITAPVGSYPKGMPEPTYPFKLELTLVEKQREDSFRIGKGRLAEMNIEKASDEQLTATEKATGYKRMISVWERAEAAEAAEATAAAAASSSTSATAHS